MFNFTKIKPMKNKKILIGLGILSAGIIGFFAYKNKKRLNDVSNAENLVIDDSEVSESDINYLSSNGVVNGINVKKYLTYLKNNPTDNKGFLNNRQIFSLFDNLNVRSNASFEDSTKVGVVPKKYTYLGRVSGETLDENGELWFRLTPLISNPKLKNSFKWGNGKFNPFIRYVKASAVFAQL